MSERLRDRGYRVVTRMLAIALLPVASVLAPRRGRQLACQWALAARFPAEDLTGLTPATLAAFTAARTRALWRDGELIGLTSGHRDAVEQGRLFAEEVRRTGSVAAARLRTLPPEESRHVMGTALDVRPTEGARWLERHGASFHLYRIYDNEWWHFEHQPLRDGYGEPMADTRQRLIDGTIETIRAHGLTGASARTIAATAGVNQALVFYHFGSVHDLLKAACLAATQARVGPFVERLDGVSDLRQLLALGRTLHDEERAEGNVMVLAQLLAGAQTDPTLAEATADALQLWIAPIEQALTRLLTDSPVAEVIDTAGLARAVSAGFIGLELYEGIAPADARAALDALDQLGVLLEVIDDLGPVARRALRGRLRKTTTRL